MDIEEKREKNTHHGHAIKRLRQALGIKQEKIAMEIGVSQQAISGYEKKAVLEDELLEKIAQSLGVNPELIREMEADPLTVIFENNKVDTNNGTYTLGYIAGDNINNPVDKIVELCEKLLEKEQEKIALLEKLLKGKE